jgi:hypothetical protein
MNSSQRYDLSLHRRDHRHKDRNPLKHHTRHDRLRSESKVSVKLFAGSGDDSLGGVHFEVVNLQVTRKPFGRSWICCMWCNQDQIQHRIHSPWCIAIVSRSKLANRFANTVTRATRARSSLTSSTVISRVAIAGSSLFVASTFVGALHVVVSRVFNGEKIRILHSWESFSSSEGISKTGLTRMVSASSIWLFMLRSPLGVANPYSDAEA